MLPLHEADKDQFKSCIISDIEGKEEYNNMLNILENIVGQKKFIVIPNVEFISIIKYQLY